jgi:hypothetical protein
MLKYNSDMTIAPGLYRLFWKSGGTSVASVGCDYSGRNWFAPTNWIGVPSFYWSLVESFEQIDVVENTKEAPRTAARSELATVREEIVRVAAVVQALKPRAICVPNGDGDYGMEYCFGNRDGHRRQVRKLLGLLDRELELLAAQPAPAAPTADAIAKARSDAFEEALDSPLRRVEESLSGFIDGDKAVRT